MNISEYLSDFSSQNPEKIAVVDPKSNSSITFEQLNSLSNQFANGLEKLGAQKGSKFLLFVRPSLQFHALVFALFKLGIVPVMIDPGMGRKNLLRAIKEVEPVGLIAEPEVHFISLLFPSAFKSVKIKVTAGTFGLFGKWTTLATLRDASNIFEDRSFEPSDLAAILFTSGGTGSPKGVSYTHGIFWEQTAILKKLFNLNPKEVDLPGFPLFSLFTLAMGMSSVIPEMDPSKPGQCDPAKLVKNIRDHSATFVAGSPAIWKRVAHYCIEQGITLPSVKYLVMFGAPIPNILHEQFQKILINGDTYTPYGATESLPVANIAGSYVLNTTAQDTSKGRGTCVGFPVPGVEVKVIAVDDNPITAIKDATLLAVGEIGEIIVKGDVVTKEYYTSEEGTKLAKIYDGDTLWHRMGDLGHLDDEGKLWFCGRKTHRVDVGDVMFCSIPCEAIVNNHEAITKSALIGLNGTPSIVIEKSSLTNVKDEETLVKEVKALLADSPITEAITDVYFYDTFPVDIRHNIKIDRLAIRDAITRSVS